MEQQIRINTKEILRKLDNIQKEITSIKDNLTTTNELTLDEEMKLWEQASEEDIIKWEKENLKDE